jgi:nitroreductase
MDFFETISRRHSTRAFSPRAIPSQAVQQILRCIQAAPSAGNLQAFRVVVVTRPELKQALARAAHSQAFVAAAPIVLVFLADPARSGARYGSRGEDLYSLQDATIACAHAQLAAAALGLASCWVGAFDEAAVRLALDAPASLRPVALLPVGYGGEEPEPTPRLDLKSLVIWKDV